MISFKRIFTKREPFPKPTGKLPEKNWPTISCTVSTTPRSQECMVSFKGMPACCTKKEPFPKPCVTWCFTFTQPGRLYPGEANTTGPHTKKIVIGTSHYLHFTYLQMRKRYFQAASPIYIQYKIEAQLTKSCLIHCYDARSKVGR